MEKSENRVRYLLRVLRPLFWWALLILVLYGIRTHERLMEKTRLYFNVSLEGKPFDADVRFDGQPALSGQRIPLGKHHFTVNHLKAKPFSTNLFIWYGRHDFGTIDLKRATGVLAVTAYPAASLLSIQGPEWSVTLTNSSGTNATVPTDDYTVTAKYPHSLEQRLITVMGNTMNPLQIAPKFGVLQVACNQSDATFQLLRQNGEIVETGNLPATVGELPEGTYKLVAWHRSREWTEKPVVRGGVTNDLRIEFKYGTAVIETTPSGATVTTPDGQERGVTPLTLTELQPGTWKFDLRLYNYEPATVLLEVPADQTNTVRTNLISLSYSGAMRSARQFMDSGDYDKAAEYLAEALRVEPDDPAATALKREAMGLRSITRAEAMGKRGDYIAGIKELDTALAALPESERARQLLADFKQHEPEQIEQQRLERLNRGKKIFDELIASKYPDGSLFETHEIKTTNALKDIELPILHGLGAAQPKFTVKYNEAPDVFVIEAVQEFSTALATSAGKRQCLIVGAQTKDDETQVLFKVLEYKAEAKEKFSIGTMIGAPAEVTYVPMRASGESEKLQARLAEGVSNVTAIVQGGIDQSSGKGR